MELLGSLERCVADKDQVKKVQRDNYKPATTEMPVMVPHGQMCKTCVQIKNIKELYAKMDDTCKQVHTCYICKAYADTHENRKYSTDREK
eukprot:7883670-Heterocapsa_arctica.AAC.1